MSPEYELISTSRRKFLETSLEKYRERDFELYDNTPIDAEWIVACGGVFDGHGLYRFPTDRDPPACAANESIRWTVASYRGSIQVVTRGEFRRASELLRITFKEPSHEPPQRPSHYPPIAILP